MKRLRKSLGCLLVLCLCAASIAGCAKKDLVRIGCAPDAQDEIIAWMMQELAQNQGFDAEVRPVSDGISDLQPALESGSLQIGIEFTQSAWSFVLKEKENYTPADLTALQREYEKKKLTWISLPMVIDHYTLAVSSQTAAKYQLKTLSDLAKVSDKLTLGGPTSFFEGEDGYPRLTRLYNLEFAGTQSLPAEGTIDALRKNKADAIPVHSLDGQLSRSAIVILEDDMNAYQDSKAGIVIADSLLMKDPQFAKMASSIGSVLDSEELTFYARLCAKEVCTPKEAALVLLKGHDLVIEEQNQ